MKEQRLKMASFDEADFAPPARLHIEKPLQHPLNLEGREFGGQQGLSSMKESSF